MKKIFWIARREFMATVATRAFLVGILILPVMIALFALIGPRVFNLRNFKVQGELLVIDATGRVVPELHKAFDPAVIEARRKDEAQRALAGAPQQLRQFTRAASKPGAVLEPVPDVRVTLRPPDTDIEKEKDWLNTQPKEMPHLALAVIHRDAVEPAGGSLEYGSYDLYVPPNLDNRAGEEIQRGLREAIVNARLKTRSLDQETIDAIVRVGPVKSITVTQNEQRQTVKGFNMLLPAAFGFLLFMGVMGGGGQLLTTMVEEKSSRVIEVLLSAVSPIELMAGKLLGQMGASFIGMGLYVGMGLAMLAFFALLGLLKLSLIFYLVIFFIITYTLVGSLMMAVGAAVNDMKEAQGLMAPLTIVFIIPWILWMPISQNPGSAFSVAISFIPPMNTFAMLLRMASNVPPPLWQVWLSIAVGIAAAYGALWFTAKIFRIGLLMYGKPPNLATFIRWARAA